ncbi:glycosyltransferase [Jannaschia formosa]|uniref:glycosyltransferase n=1 Tax=Jannaschia formosa TaxID=2259592 RepID=UPI001430749B|nr:glycosyltransferase [Jannaschia formosa]
MQRLGMPSEVWALRQIEGFDALAPILVGWEAEPDATLPQLEQRRVAAPFPPSGGLARRVAARAGLAWGRAPNRSEASAIRDALRGTDAALCHFGWTAMAVAAAMPRSYPVIWHMHGRDASVSLRWPGYRAGLRRHLRHAALLVTVGAHQLERLAPFGLPDRRVVLPCGAPLALFAAGPLPVQDDGRVRFASVGRLSPEKGMEETLAAFERIAPDLPGAELVLIGGGPLAGTLAARAAAGPAAGRVRLTGPLPPAGVAAELARAHVYLQHSREIGGSVEGFGVTLAEAAAVGLPLLASATGGLIDQIVEGENGHLFPAGDVAAQAALMHALAADPARRARLGEGARRLAVRFDSAVQARRLQAEILAALAARAALPTGPGARQ